MTDHDDPQHRAYHQSDPDRVELREELDGDDGVFTVRMPLASTGEVRNQGDEPLTADELRGMADQIDDRGVGVFLDHGTNMDIGGSRYSAVGKVGEWQDAEVGETDAGETLLTADARIMDPETLPAASGSVREALAAVKSQVQRDIGLSSSIGWRDDEDYPGGVDLMEASIVGIPADPRTTSHDGVVAMARAAADARPDVDPEQLVADFRAVVMGPAENGGGDARDTMSDDTTESGDQPDTDRDDSDGMDGADEFRQFMREQMKTQNELLRTLAETREDGEDDDEDDDDEDEDEDMDGEQSADEEADERSLTIDDEEVTAEDVREMREQLADAEPDTGGDDDVDGDERDASEDEQPADPKNLL